jgi:hypothetical protein
MNTSLNPFAQPRSYDSLFPAASSNRNQAGFRYNGNPAPSWPVMPSFTPPGPFDRFERQPSAFPGGAAMATQTPQGPAGWFEPVTTALKQRFQHFGRLASTIAMAVTPPANGTAASPSGNLLFGSLVDLAQTKTQTEALLGLYGQMTSMVKTAIDKLSGSR